MSLSAKEAAEQVGMSKQGIIKAIRTGKISAEKDVHGEWKIQPIELYRVYTPVDTNGHQPELTSSRQDTADDTPSLRREVELLREMLQAKDEVIKAKEDALEDLRRAMLMIEARSAAAPPSPAPQTEQPKGFWQRLLGR